MARIPTLQQDVDRGLEIMAAIAKLKEELKPIKARIDAAAESGAQIPLEDAERDGMQFLATGSLQIVPVILTADCLKKTFAKDTKEHVRIAEAAGDLFPSFFHFKPKYEAVTEDGKQFRRLARQILGEEKAIDFIDAVIDRDRHGIPKSATKIEWDRARPIVTSNQIAA